MVRCSGGGRGSWKEPLYCQAVTAEADEAVEEVERRNTTHEVGEYGNCEYASTARRGFEEWNEIDENETRNNNKNCKHDNQDQYSSSNHCYSNSCRDDKCRWRIVAVVSGLSVGSHAWRQTLCGVYGGLTKTTEAGSSDIQWQLTSDNEFSVIGNLGILLGVYDIFAAGAAGAAGHLLFDRHSGRTEHVGHAAALAVGVQWAAEALFVGAIVLQNRVLAWLAQALGGSASGVLLLFQRALLCTIFPEASASAIAASICVSTIAKLVACLAASFLADALLGFLASPCLLLVLPLVVPFFFLLSLNLLPAAAVHLLLRSVRQPLHSTWIPPFKSTQINGGKQPLIALASPLLTSTKIHSTSLLPTQLQHAEFLSYTKDSDDASMSSHSNSSESISDSAYYTAYTRLSGLDSLSCSNLLYNEINTEENNFKSCHLQPSLHSESHYYSFPEEKKTENSFENKYSKIFSTLFHSAYLKCKKPAASINTCFTCSNNIDAEYSRSAVSRSVGADSRCPTSSLYTDNLSASLSIPQSTNFKSSSFFDTCDYINNNYNFYAETCTENHNDRKGVCSSGATYEYVIANRKVIPINFCNITQREPDTHFKFIIKIPTSDNVDAGDNEKTNINFQKAIEDKIVTSFEASQNATIGTAAGASPFKRNKRHSDTLKPYAVLVTNSLWQPSTENVQVQDLDVTFDNVDTNNVNNYKGNLISSDAITKETSSYIMSQSHTIDRKLNKDSSINNDDAVFYSYQQKKNCQDNYETVKISSVSQFSMEDNSSISHSISLPTKLDYQPAKARNTLTVPDVDAQPYIYLKKKCTQPLNYEISNNTFAEYQLSSKPYVTLSSSSNIFKLTNNDMQSLNIRKQRRKRRNCLLRFLKYELPDIRRKLKYLSINFWIISILHALYLSVTHSFSNFSTAIFLEAFVQKSTQAGLINGIYAGMIVIFCPIAGFFVDNIGYGLIVVLVGELLVWLGTVASIDALNIQGLKHKNTNKIVYATERIATIVHGNIISRNNNASENTSLKWGMAVAVLLGISAAIGPVTLLSKIPHPKSVLCLEALGLAFGIAEFISTVSVALFNIIFGYMVDQSGNYTASLIFLLFAEGIMIVMLFFLLAKDGILEWHNYITSKASVRLKKSPVADLPVDRFLNSPVSFTSSFVCRGYLQERIRLRCARYMMNHYFQTADYDDGVYGPELSHGFPRTTDTITSPLVNNKDHSNISASHDKQISHTRNLDMVPSSTINLTE